jgi:ribonuclease HII
MHRALDTLKTKPEFILVDGNRFKKYQDLPHQCIIKGDGKYFSIAAASILAKTYRDDFMERIAVQYPQYDWSSNKGYPTIKHREAVLQYGFSPYHRRSFKVTDPQLTLFQ